MIMGGLALSKVGYDRYLKFVWPFLVVVFVVCCAFVGIAAALALTLKGERNEHRRPHRRSAPTRRSGRCGR